MSNLLSFNNISKSYNHNIVLKDCSLEIKTGALIHIKGRNGSGKSTLLKILVGILNADSGIIKKAEKTYIGALIENPEFAEYSTIKDNLDFLSELNNNYNQDKIKNLCDSFYLDYFDKKYMKKYSIGMKQKVGIIQAIMEDQNLILLDEPTRGLDEASIEVFKNKINSLIIEKKCAVIITSHDYVEGLNYTNFYQLENGVLNEV